MSSTIRTALNNLKNKIPEVINCRAAVLWREGTPLTIENITVDPPKTGEVRVRSVSSGVCASDAHLVWGWDTDLIFKTDGNPMVLGHEGSGIVEAVGEGVTSVDVGDHVLSLWMPNCGTCKWCTNPLTNFCAKDNLTNTLYHANGETRMKINEKPLLAFLGTASFSEYAVLRESQVAKINRNANLKNACILTCAVGTGYETAINIAKIIRGSTCAVWGIGAIGLSAMLGCKEMGANKIIAIDINSEKSTIAKQFGCTDFINPKELSVPLDKHLRKTFKGIDYAFDCIGNKEVLETALRSLTMWGSLIVVGLGKRGNTIEIPVADLLTGKRLVGGYFGNQKTRHTNQQLVEKYLNGKLPIDPLITHRFKLDQINEAFDLLKCGKSIRSVIDF